MFERTLAILKHQADANILFKPTYESVGGLYAYLKSEYRSYFSRSCTSADERIFLEECSRAIHNARPILARDPYATSCWSIFHKRRSFAYITQTLDVLAEAFDGRDLERDLTLRH